MLWAHPASHLLHLGWSRAIEWRPRHESIVQTDTQSKPVEIQSHTARRGGALPAQTTRSPQGAVQPDQPCSQRDAGPPASARGPTARPRHRAQSRGGPLSSPALFRRSPWLSRRLSRPYSTGLGPRHQERTVSSNHHSLGHPAFHRAPRRGSYPAGLAPEPSPLYQWAHLDDRYQYWPGDG